MVKGSTTVQSDTRSPKTGIKTTATFPEVLAIFLIFMELSRSSSNFPQDLKLYWSFGNSCEANWTALKMSELQAIGLFTPRGPSDIWHLKIGFRSLQLMKQPITRLQMKNQTCKRYMNLAGKHPKGQATTVVWSHVSYEFRTTTRWKLFPIAIWLEHDLFLRVVQKVLSEYPERLPKGICFVLT